MLEQENTSGGKPTIGQRIRILREARGMTRGRLAQLSAVSAAYIGQVEEGIRPKPSVHIVVALAEALRVETMDEITGYDVTALPPESPEAAVTATVERIVRLEEGQARLEGGQGRLEAGLTRVAEGLALLLKDKEHTEEAKARAAEQVAGTRRPPVGKRPPQSERAAPQKGARRR